jgi:hypothetical protein
MAVGNKKWIEFWVTTAFLYIFIVGVLGLAMRSLLLTNLPLPFHNILHAHSHTALLGWAFVMATQGLLNHLGIEKFVQLKWYIITYTFSIVGMFVAFLYQSYGAISIAFSTLFVFTSYLFFYRLWKLFDGKSVIDTLWKSSIGWFYLSTFGVWCLGPSSAILGKEHWLYNLSIQFFLHFQINGWLLFVVLAILLKYVKKEFLPTKNTVYLLNVSLVLTFGLNIYWVNQHSFFYILNAVGILLQLAVYLKFAQIIWKYSPLQISKIMQLILRMVLLALVVKGIIQGATLFPNYSLILQSNRFLIIAFIHLILLGFVSFGFIYISIQEKILPANKGVYIGLGLWMLGFVVTEAITAALGYGYSFSYSIQWLWLFSFVMLIGISVLFYQRFKHRY